MVQGRTDADVGADRQGHEDGQADGAQHATRPVYPMRTVVREHDLRGLRDPGKAGIVLSALLVRRWRRVCRVCRWHSAAIAPHQHGIPVGVLGYGKGGDAMERWGTLVGGCVTLGVLGLAVLGCDGVFGDSSGDVVAGDGIAVSGNTVSIADAGVTAPKLHRMGAVDGDALRWDDSATSWAPAAMDADTLDGQDSVAFAPAAHNHDGTYMPTGTDNWVNTSGDTMTGDLGIVGNLTVTGNASVGGVLTLPTSTRYLALHHTAFDCSEYNVFWRRQDDRLFTLENTGTAVAFYAPFQVPHGATLVSFAALVRDVHADYDIQVAVGYVDASGNAVSLGAVGTTGTPDLTTITGGLGNHAVQNDSEAFYVKASWISPGGGDIELRRVSIAYTVTQPLP